MLYLDKTNIYIYLHEYVNAYTVYTYTVFMNAYQDHVPYLCICTLINPIYAALFESAIEFKSRHLNFLQ